MIKDEHMFGLCGAILFAVFAVLVCMYCGPVARGLVILLLWLGAASQLLAQSKEASIRRLAYYFHLIAFTGSGMLAVFILFSTVLKTFD